MSQNTAGTAGCITNTGLSGTCIFDSRTITSLFGADITDDGASYYATSLRSSTDGAVFGYNRNATTGELSQMAGTFPCVSFTGDSGVCANGEAIRRTVDLDASSDGKNVYAAAFASWAVAVLTRNVSTGALSQPASATADCICETGLDGNGSTYSATCYDGHGLYNPAGVAVSNDSKNVYVASDATDGGSGTVAVLVRNTTTGALSQDATTTGALTQKVGTRTGRTSTSPPLSASPSSRSPVTSPPASSLNRPASASALPIPATPAPASTARPSTTCSTSPSALTDSTCTPQTSPTAVLPSSSADANPPGSTPLAQPGLARVGRRP